MLIFNDLSFFQKTAFDFIEIKNSKTSSGKEVYIIISKTVSSNEDLEKLKEKVKNYSYQIINQK